MIEFDVFELNIYLLTDTYTDGSMKYGYYIYDGNGHGFGWMFFYQERIKAYSEGIGLRD